MSSRLSMWAMFFGLISPPLACRKMFHARLSTFMTWFLMSSRSNQSICLRPMSVNRWCLSATSMARLVVTKNRPSRVSSVRSR
uniref:Putative secreted protein n=1 Tax=Anopheles darlingi TaxID=43151 RepID=A0A2M4DM65_ANODA